MDGVLDTLRKANEQYPESKVVWVAVAVAAASAIIASLKLGWGALLAGSIYVLGTIVLFSFVLLIYNIFSSLGESVPGAKWLAAMVAWSSTALIIGSVVMLLSCLFLGKPKTLRELIYDANPIIESSDQIVEDDAVIESPEQDSAGETGTDAEQNKEQESGVLDTDLEPPTTSIDECLDSIDEGVSVKEFERMARECTNR